MLGLHEPAVSQSVPVEHGAGIGPAAAALGILVPAQPLGLTQGHLPLGAAEGSVRLVLDLGPARQLPRTPVPADLLARAHDILDAPPALGQQGGRNGDLAAVLPPHSRGDLRALPVQLVNPPFEGVQVFGERGNFASKLRVAEAEDVLQLACAVAEQEGVVFQRNRVADRWSGHRERGQGWVQEGLVLREGHRVQVCVVCASVWMCACLSAGLCQVF